MTNKQRSERRRCSHFQGGDDRQSKEAEPVIHLPRRIEKVKENNQRPILSKDDIPDGFVALASYGAHNPKKKIKSSREYRILSNAWTEKRLGGVKLLRSIHDKRGHVFVCKVEADELIASKIKKTVKELIFEGCKPPKKSRDFTHLINELKATNENLMSLITQLQSAIEAAQRDTNWTLFN